ncbi:MAG TPA: sensor histidine kinase, partial [Candidatus Limnocylindrales bacterium]
ERASLIRQLEAAQRELAEREREAGVLAERTRMSRELHDTLAQDLVGVVTHLQAADAAAETGQTSEAARHRDEAARMARDGLAETRRLVWALRPADLEGTTLVESLERTLERWRSTSGLRGTLTVTGAVRDLHPDVEVTLLRGAQEGLTNAARHGSATQVTVTLSYLDDTVTLDVHDDGVGFDPDAVTPVTSRPGTGLGLRGMRERAERLGGAVAIESAPGEGTTVGLSLPAPSASS